ncbi:MAG: choice-of-anchor J domain-containing protein [Bacteroidales bacterium]|nr:choice-of-anchor J domain-containing protein [Bacteroidales bacterium]
MKKVLLLLLLCVVGFAAPQTMKAVDRTTLYAVVANEGIYAFDPQNLQEKPQLVMSDDNYGYLTDGSLCAFGDGVLYVYQYKERNYSLSSVRFIKYRMQADGTWTCDVANDVKSLPLNYEAFPHMFTYDPYSKKLYGFRRGASPSLYEINPTTGEMTLIADGCSLNYNSMVASANGNLYVMGETNTHDVEYIFVKDKSSIKHDMVAGYPNLLSDDVLLSSFAGNSSDNLLYIMNRNQKNFSETEEGINNSTTDWNANNIYTIDTKNFTYNKDAKKLGSVFGGKKVVGFFAVSEEVAAAQLPPAACTDLSVVYTTPGKTAATISAKAPTMLFDGKSPMETPATVNFYLGSRLIGQKQSVAAGATASISYDFVNEGPYTLRVTATNENGDGPDAFLETYAGYDTPGAVTDVKLAIDEAGHYTLTWKAPEAGANGGVYNTSIVQYVVTRYPGGTATIVNATTAEGEIGSNLFSDYYFTVAATCGTKTGEAVTSNHAHFGEAIELPYVDDFSDEATWGRHTIWNVNGDATWERGASMLDGVSASYNGANCKNQADDWLFTPPMKLHAGTTYTIKFKAFNNQYLTSSPTPLKLYVSPTAHPETFMDEPESHMELVASISTLPSWLDPMSAEYLFECKDEYIGYLAFHLSAYPNTRVWIQEYSIVPGASKNAPADVSRLRVEPDEEGAVKATISFIAPTTTMSEGELTSIDYISIYRDGDLNEIHRFLNPAPGAELTYVDEAEDLTNDNHEYKVKCFNANGNSEGVARTVLVGEDYALSPLNLRVEDLGDVFRMTWEKPEGSVYGGYVNLDNVKYWIMIGNAEGEGNPVTLEDFYEGYSYDVDKSQLYLLGLREDQMLINFWCVSVTPRGSHINGSVAYTSAIYGTPWDLPFNEGLAVDDFGVFSRTYPWTVVTYDPYAAAGKDPWFFVRSDNEKLPISGINDHDGTGAMFMWYQTVAKNMESYFVMPQIDFAPAKKPTITFWVWHNNGVATPTDNWLKIYSSRFTGEYDEIPGFETIYIADGQPNGWRQHTVDLSAVPYDVYRIAFHGRGEAGLCYYIDDIVVDDADNEDGINTVLRPADDNTPVYDLSGRRINSDAHGIRVKGGMKVIE